MKLDQKTIEFIADKMRDFYCREGIKNTLAYDFGFFDALHVVEEIYVKAGFNK